MFKLLKLTFDKKSWLFFIINTIFSILQTLGYIAIPILLTFLNQLGDLESSYDETLFPWLDSTKQSIILMSIMVVLSLLSFIFGIISIYFSSKLSTYLTNNLRIRVFKKAISFSIEDWNSWNKQQILNFITVDLTYISNAFEFLFRIIYKTIFMYLGSIIGILVISFGTSTINVQNYPNIPNWSMTVVAIGISIVMFGLIIIISNFASKKFSKNQQILDNVNEFIENDIYAQKTIKLLNLKTYQNNKFKAINNDMKHVYIRTGLIQSAILPTIYFFLDVSIVIATWLTPKTMIAQLSSYLLFLGLILSAMVSCSLAIININKGIACSKRIMNFLNYKNKILYSSNDISFTDFNLSINNLYYSYNNSSFELNIPNLEIKENTKIGIFGPTNSGKTTFINLLIKQLKLLNGIIKIGEFNISDLSKENISEIFSYCPQEPQLFSGTIKSNLLLSNSRASTEEINKVLDFVNLSNIPHDMSIGEFGKKLSGGQRQRLMIAKTLLSKSKVLIYDDCFSALDMLTQSNIINKILNLNNKTIIINSQKINLLKNCEIIYVIDNGKIISYGNHNELLKNCDIYKKSYMEATLD